MHIIIIILNISWSDAVISW